MIPQDILESNRDLTPGERQDAKKLAEDTDVKLKVVQEALDKLKREENELLETARNCRLALSPIRRLPRDVISEIFMTCKRLNSQPAMSPKKAPVLLTHICSDFRHLALSMSMLWATITLNIPKVRGNHEHEEEHSIIQLKSYLQSRADVIEKWVDRSGTAPLSIVCMSSMESNMLQHFQEEQYALAEALLRGAAHWRYLSLRFQECSPLFVRIMDLTPDKVPMLTAIRISVSGRDEQLLPGNIFQAGNLTELCLYGRFDATNYHVNWSQLTWLILNPSPWRATAKILRQAKKLIRLSFDDSKTVDDIRDIYLPYLRELSISDDGTHPGNRRSVAANIHAPVLEALRADVCVLQLSNLVKRSPRLRNLVIRIDVPHAVNAWLRNCPQITSLGLIKSWPWSPNRTGRITGILEELILDREGTYTCPNLHTLFYDGIVMVPSDVLCRFLGDEHGRSDTRFSRTWEHVGLRVSITDWESMNMNGKALLNDVVEKWKSAGVLRLEIMNTETESQ